MMRRTVGLICAIVLGAGAAASAGMGRDQLRGYFNNTDPYSRGFQAGYAQGVADASAAAYGNPGVINANVQQCVQTQPFPTLLQLAGAAFRRWLSGNDPRVNAATSVLGAYYTCTAPGPAMDRPDRQ